MYRFLLRPRWIAGHLLVIVTVVAFVNLGLWQLRRLDERQAHNALVTERLAAGPQQLDAVLAAVGGDPDAVAFRRVTVGGAYAGPQVLTAPRSYAGRAGQQVLGVLERADGPDVLIDRGWIPFDSRLQQAPPTPDGQVQIEGVVRLREPGDAGDAAPVAQIVPAQIGQRLGRDVSPFYVQLRRQRPPVPAGAPRPTPLPELTEGNHGSYAVQWFSFALIALVGYPILLRRQALRDDSPDAGPPHAGGRNITVGSAARS
jgi:cytochrome oxidase assembly protein ShyY1